MIEFRRVSFTYARGKRRAISDFSKIIKENTVISGPSGSGKSTILRFINGLIPHFFRGEFTGDVFVNGENTRELTTCDLFKRAGFVHQNPDAQVFNEDARKELIFTLENAGLPPREIKRRIDETVEKLGIRHLLNRKSHELSGGEKHLLTLASIIALGSPIILLDEPFSTLDGYYRHRLKSVLKGLKRLLVITEHRLEETLDLAGEFILIKNDSERMYTRDLSGVDLTTFRIREPEIFRISRETGVRLTGQNLIERLKKTGYRRDFFCPEVGETVLEALGVYYSYNGGFSLGEVDFHLGRGDVVVILGHNGAGKTTLMKVLAGIRKPGKGKVLRLGKTGYVPHNPQDIFFRTKVIDELKVSATDETWLNWIVQALFLEGTLERSPFLLSEGEKKRVAMAAVLASKPDIVFLDEPTTGQDGETVNSMAKIIKRLSEKGISVVVSTHDIEFAKEISCRWLLMEDGKIVAEINPAGVLYEEIKLMERLHIDPGIELRVMADGSKG